MGVRRREPVEEEAGEAARRSPCEGAAAMGAGIAEPVAARWAPVNSRHTAQQPRAHSAHAIQALILFLGTAASCHRGDNVRPQVIPAKTPEDAHFQ